MPTIKSASADIHYDVRGKGSPVLLLVGLGGVGAAWGPQIELFASHHQVIVPDHRGTGRSTATLEGLTIAQHAEDFARLIDHLGCGPVHCVGHSTGGAITQVMALEHEGVVKTATIASSWARHDAFFKRQFAARAQMLKAAGPRAANELGAIFLFDPRFQALDPKAVESWVDAATASATPPEISAARIDMIVAHDRLEQLHKMRCPTHIVVGQADFCTPPHLSEQMAAVIPGAQLSQTPGGHFNYLEHPAVFYETVQAFIRKHGG